MASPTADLAALGLRLERLEAAEAIRDLAHRYCWGADHRDLAAWRSVWAPDAVWAIGPGREFVGVEAITGAVRRQWESFPQMLHATSNHRIEIDDDRATGLADVLVMTRLGSGDDGDGSWVAGGGTYRDAYERGGDTWRIRRREATDTFLMGPIATFTA